MSLKTQKGTNSKPDQLALDLIESLAATGQFARAKQMATTATHWFPHMRKIYHDAKHGTQKQQTQERPRNTKVYTPPTDPEEKKTDVAAVTSEVDPGETDGLQSLNATAGAIKRIAEYMDSTPGFDPLGIHGTGRGGKITAGDVDAFINTQAGRNAE